MDWNSFYSATRDLFYGGSVQCLSVFLPKEFKFAANQLIWENILS